MESLSIWSLAGVVLSSRPYSSKYTEGVAHISYDVTVSNGVNLCHPGAKRCTYFYAVFGVANALKLGPSIVSRTCQPV